MKNKHLTVLLTSICLFSCAPIDNPPVTPPGPDDPPVVDPDPSGEEVALANAKSEAIEIINTYVNPDDYREAEKAIILECQESCIRLVNRATTISAVNSIVDYYKDSVKDLKTDAQYTLEETPTFEKCVTTAQNEKFRKMGYLPLYKDNNFKNGFIVGKTYQKQGENPHHEEYLKYYDNDIKPTWTIAQWSSRYDIMGDGEKDGYTLTTDSTGLINTITSKGKEVDGKFMPGKVITLNTIDGSIYLEANTQVEYETHRTGSEGWVHLLLSQGFDDNLTNISECESVIMDAEVTPIACDNLMGEAFQRNKHTGQTVWYLTVQNRNRKSAEYGKYIWFGVSIWDYRLQGDYFNGYIAHDAGTNTLIYNIPSVEYYKENNGKEPMLGERGHINVDIMPFIKEGFIYAKEHGYFNTTTFEELCFGGTNFGYEIPGTFNMKTDIHCINVYVKRKK